MPIPLEKEFQYYLAHQQELVSKYDGKVVVIRDQKVIGTFDDEMSAIAETSKQHPLGTFLVQTVSAGSAGHTQTFHSRVAFG
jgi:hypothetical protein